MVLQVFLVGDPNQLPATVLSAAALEHGYNTSMFQRLQAAGYPVQVGRRHAACLHW
jgi:senataxin